MPESDDAPRWDLLPAEPARFFGLPAAFDRLELRRRYHNFLRRFKPEKFPAEFQQIRAAYETLDRELRIRESSSIPESPVPNTGAATPGHHFTSTDESAAKALPGPTPGVSPLYRLLGSAPEVLRRELTAKSSKSPQEHLLLTLLNDAMGDPHGEDFLTDLLAGLRSAPHDPRLRELLRVFLGSDEARGRCQAYLSRVFAELPCDFVVSMTEPLWDQFALEAPLPIFREALNDAFERIQDSDHVDPLLFEIRLVKRLLFRADRQWVAENIARLTAADVDCRPASCDKELWIIGGLADYWNVRDSFLKGHPLRERFDAVVRGYCEAPPDFEQLFFDCHAEFARAPDALDEAFPFGEDLFCEPAWRAWNCICVDVSERYAIDFDEIFERATCSVPYLPAQLEKASRPRILPGRDWRLLDWAFVATGIGIGFLSVNLLLVPESAAMKTLSWFVAMMSGLTTRVVVTNILPFRSVEFARRVYREHLRPVLRTYLNRFPIPVPLLYEQLTEYDLGSRRVARILSHLDKDIAMRLYSNAVRFTH